MGKKDERLKKPRSDDSAQFHSRSPKDKERKATEKNIHKTDLYYNLHKTD